jgi:hypothetical protein
MLCTWIVLSPIIFAQSNGPLKLIKSIGDEREHYTIFGAGDALLTPDKDIYILNTRGNFISHFDWNGQFKRRIGQKGQGPGDFYFPWSLANYNKKLYIHDKGNTRIAEFNPKTNKFSFYKENTGHRLAYLRHVIHGERYLVIFRTIAPNRGRIGILDKEMNILHSFFNDFPIPFDLKRSSTALPEEMSPETAVRLTVINKQFEPTYAYHPKHREVLVSFMQPDNPIKFYVYNTRGKLLRSFSFHIKDKKYKFQDFFLKANMTKIANVKSYPERYEPYLRVFITERHYIGFLVLNHFPKGQKNVETRKCFLLIFNRKGEIINQFPLADQTQLLRYANGYFLGIFLDDEVERLFIYQLSL